MPLWPGAALSRLAIPMRMGARMKPWKSNFHSSDSDDGAGPPDVVSVLASASGGGAGGGAALGGATVGAAAAAGAGEGCAGGIGPGALSMVCACALDATEAERATRTNEGE